jgi:crotonobetainyl-CoA:carnitine CoA-transferase CaiB-like acyl-CoA transferase
MMSLTGRPVGQPVGTAFSLVDRTTSLHATIGALRPCATVIERAKAR